MSHLIADWVLLEGGFAPDMRLTIEDGSILAVEPNAGRQGGERVGGAVLPGMTDLHSHAFQRSFAGCAEFAGGGSDFWSWREAMYRAADRIEPETLAPIASYLAMEKLRGGYTSVVEFHYLQHQRDGTPYADRNAMAAALIEGAAEAGIGMTLLFGIYEMGGFAGEVLEGAQRRFANSAEDALAMFAHAQAQVGPSLRFGIAPHSLRAVRPGSLKEAADGLAVIDPAAPIHIHAAEQTAENAACVAALGTTPVAWLLDHMPVSDRWCLIHATHTSDAERTGMARAEATAGLCPSTEGNLGDGIFELAEFVSGGGRFGIGTDSNVTLDAFAELRLAEYVQRLHLRRRNVLAGLDGHSGRILWQAAARGGAAASARPVGRIAPGCRADLVVIEPTPETASASADFWLDSAIFSQGSRAARHVMCGGEWVVRDFTHVRQAAILSDYRQALARVRA